MKRGCGADKRALFSVVPTTMSRNMSIRGNSRKRLSNTGVNEDVQNGIRSKYFHPETIVKARTSTATANNVMTFDTKQSNALPSTSDSSTSKSSCGLTAVSAKLRLGPSFFEQPCSKLAKSLLGKRLVRKIGSERYSGKIVETEAYLGLEDKAAHSYQGKRTERNEAMFMPPGTSYVYNIYGMYCCFNISSAGDGCAVLVRALEPEEGVPTMQTRRKLSAKKKQKTSDLTNGPSKLCQALDIKKDSCNKIDLRTSPELWLEEGEIITDASVIECPRINIGYAEEWMSKPLRFYIKDNPCVSVKFKG